jgi:hypothetical protein
MPVFYMVRLTKEITSLINYYTTYCFIHGIIIHHLNTLKSSNIW